MPVVVLSCPSCQKKFGVSLASLGGAVTCSHCGVSVLTAGPVSAPPQAILDAEELAGRPARQRERTLVASETSFASEEHLPRAILVDDDRPAAPKKKRKRRAYTTKQRSFVWWNVAGAGALVVGLVGLFICYRMDTTVRVTVLNNTQRARQTPQVEVFRNAGDAWIAWQRDAIEGQLREGLAPKSDRWVPDQALMHHRMAGLTISGMVSLAGVLILLFTSFSKKCVAP